MSAGLPHLRVVGMHSFEEGDHASGSTEVSRGSNQGGPSTVLLTRPLFLEIRVSSPCQLVFGFFLFLPSIFAAVVQGRHQRCAIALNAAL